MTSPPQRAGSRKVTRNGAMGTQQRSKRCPRCWGCSRNKLEVQTLSNNLSERLISSIENHHSGRLGGWLGGCFHHIRVFSVQSWNPGWNMDELHMRWREPSVGFVCATSPLRIGRNAETRGSSLDPERTSAFQVENTPNTWNIQRPKKSWFDTFDGPYMTTVPWNQLEGMATVEQLMYRKGPVMFSLSKR